MSEIYYQDDFETSKTTEGHIKKQTSQRDEKSFLLCHECYCLKHTDVRDRQKPVQGVFIWYE